MKSLLPGDRRRLLVGLASATTGSLLTAQVLAQDQRPSPPAGAGAGAVDPRQFGARLDGETDDAAALRAALATGLPVSIVGRMRIDEEVDVPPEALLLGAGMYRTTLVIGPRGRLRVAGAAYDRHGGGGAWRDLTIASADRGSARPGVQFSHVEHFAFDQVTFYRIGVLLDDHHYLGFRDCRFFGDEDRVRLVANCASQPPGQVGISAALQFSGCFFSSYPVFMEDVVAARVTDSSFLAGRVGLVSRARLARGTDAKPFLMGPVISGCVFDSIEQLAIDVELGGTDCRLVNTFISCGRSAGHPGVRFARSSGVEIIGNRFEWCGTTGLLLEECEKIGIVGNSFANIADGPGIAARRTRETRVIGNAFENRLRWGGSEQGGTTLAIDDAGGSCTGWVVTGNTASGLRDGVVSTLRHSLVRDNPGWPAATEQGWPSGASAQRPTGVADGYRWYDRTLGLWIHWHAGSWRWRDPAGRAL